MASFKKIASRQDKRVAKATGLRVRPNSGAISGHKGDLGGPDIFVETKTRAEEKDHLGIDLRWMDKAKEQAFAMGKPIYFLVIAAGDEQDYVVMDYSLLSSKMPNADPMDRDVPIPDYNCLEKGNYLKVPLARLDTILYRYRRNGLPPVAVIVAKKLVADNRALAVLYLEDFVELWDDANHSTT